MTDNEFRDSWNFSKIVAINIGSVTLSKENVLAIDDFINRQRAEIERLKQECSVEVNKTLMEFAEELKKDISWHRTEMYMNGLKGTPRTHEITYECVEEYIDNLVKEFTEGE